MEATALVQYLTDSAGGQLSQVLANLDETQWDAKLEGAMSPREVVIHCSECYAAGLASLRGESHEWGTYSPVPGGPAELLAEMKRLRSALVDGALEAGTDAALKSIVDYVALHDAYHVGQLVTLRSQLDPAWNVYSIYEP
ncbi:MAG: DinB family protein [Fimbriimonadaceae bacterium]|nr:DinB family protein [Fimbriimonadaceae bacterium]